jgi:hypothetical protein
MKAWKVIAIFAISATGLSLANPYTLPYQGLQRKIRSKL